MLAVLTVMLATATPPAPAPLDAAPQTRLGTELRCLLGVYAFPSGNAVTITGDNGKPHGLRYTLANGQFGTLTKTAQGFYTAGAFAIDFAPCADRTLWLIRGEIAERGMRVGLIQNETTFTSDGVRLHGKLVLPARGRADHAAV